MIDYFVEMLDYFVEMLELSSQICDGGVKTSSTMCIRQLLYGNTYFIGGITMDVSQRIRLHL
jgi:hypothetical protein